MAKKKKTRKKTRAGTRRTRTAAKSSGARSTSKKTKKKKKKTPSRAAARKTNRKTSRKKTAKKTRRETAAKASRKTAARRPASAAKKGPKKTAKTARKTSARTSAAGKSKKKSAGAAGGKSRSRSSTASSARGAEPARPAPDADGYVIINGRRVRMMTTASRPASERKLRQEAQAAAEPESVGSSDKPVRTRLKKKDLERYRELLLQHRAELVDDLQNMEQQALLATGGNLSHMPIHMADIGTDTYDQDFMLGLTETERRRLREIDAALQRIEQGTYGICQMTAKPIPKTRLNAKPWARYTIEAAREIERGLSE